MNLTEMEYWNIVKKNFGIPYTFFELTYDDVIYYMKEYSMRFISQYVPKIDYVAVIPERDVIPGQESVLKINYDGEILSIAEVFSANLDIIVGYPINPIISDQNSAIDYAIDISKAIPNLQLSSAIHYTWEFLEPDKIKIYPPSTTDLFILRITTLHTSLDTIPSRFGRDFIDLCIADLKEQLANIRAKYNEYNTPFGTINLGADALRNEAETIRSRLLEKFQTIPPNILVSL